MKRPASETAGPRPARTWRQRGILMTLCLIFLASGLTRLGSLDLAFAETGAHAADEHADDGHAEMASAAHGGTEGTHDDDHPATVASVDAALAAIRGRAEELDAREAEIDARQARLDAAERLVTARLRELEDAEARLNALLSVADTAAESDIDQLTRFYETMSPADAAELFSQMDPSFAAGFLARMRPEAGAGVLAELTPEQAYAISVILATRNADVPVSRAAPATE
ncbi:hypothetical protein HKCCE2091_13525 [Rhodobacterales bacterium HKCCE2091]|nr:hypothetical protein [Rhodobacterales bacterium HKCCE2091]